jgi:predicted aldo/keto reductase-like oxidoreductase
MNKTRLGKSGLMVSQVGFGGIPIQRLSEAQAVAVVQHCLDRGVNYIDTARDYGTSEERIGKAIRGRRDAAILASKSTARDRAGLLADLETSLEKLGVEAIDLYQLHNVTTEGDYDKVLAPGGALEGAHEAKQTGKIRHIGVSCHSLEIAKEAVRSGWFETVMFPMNFVAREPGEELYPLAVQHDVGFVVMKPFAGGMLEDARLAFKYLAQFPHAVAIPGIEKAAEMDQILEILSQPLDLSQGEREEMERIRTELGNRFCRRCEYCQPCPQDVPVPMLMTAASVLKRMPLPQFLNFMGAAVQTAAEQCEKCGECEERCPYGLPILEMMDESISLYRRAEAQYQASSAE